MIKTATVFRHSLPDPAGTVVEFLKERDVALTHIDVFDRDSLSDIDPLEPDLLVVMGGSPGVYQAEDYPFMKEELRVLKARLAADRPTLGICLGAQLMAHALGAKVYKGRAGSEKGWHRLALTEAGKASPARHFSGEHTAIMQWHGDTFDLPEGAVLLASSAKYPHQAFRWGRNAFGFQFHPELTPFLFKCWMVDAAYDAHEGVIDLRGCRAEAEEALPRMQNQTRAFLAEWLDRDGAAG